MKVSFEDNWVVEVCTSRTYDADAGKEWTHTKLMLIVPFAISDAAAYNKGGKLDYGWGDLQFAKDYKEKHKGKSPSIMPGIFFFVPGCASGMFMSNMKSFLYDGHRVPGTPMAQMCPKAECPGGCQLCALKVAATTNAHSSPGSPAHPPAHHPLTTHPPPTSRRLPAVRDEGQLRGQLGR